jgi:hypothetical protein
VDQLKSPFKLLDAYNYGDRDYFFGRNEEIDRLYQMVFRTNLVLVYGPSGTGKTSLIQCGLASKFHPTDWYSIFVRRGDDVNQSLRDALTKALKDTETDSITTAIDRIYKYYLRPVYLIFDQFEELFILGDSDDTERKNFEETLKDIHRENHRCCIMLVMREEFIARLYDLEREMPSLANFHNRLRVEPMNYEKAFEVVKKSLMYPAFNITLEEPNANTKKILDKFTAKKTGIQLPYLQVYLDMLWKEDFERTYPDVQPERPPGLTEEDLWYPPITLETGEIETFEDIEDVLGKFLREQERKIADALGEDVPKNAVRQLLDVFVTSQGTKRPVTFTVTHEGEIWLEENVHAQLSFLEPETMRKCLDALEKARLLRRSEGSYELAHDTLAYIINQERTDEQRQLNFLRKNLGVYLTNYNDYSAFPDKKIYNSIARSFEQFSSQLPGHLVAFVESWKFYLDQEDEKERRRQQEELERERKLREEAEAQKSIAEVERYKAEEQRVIADEERLKALEAKKEAEDALHKAKRNARLATVALIISLLLGAATWIVREKSILSDAIHHKETRNYLGAVESFEKLDLGFLFNVFPKDSIELCKALKQTSDIIENADSLYFAECYREALDQYRKAEQQPKKDQDVSTKMNQAKMMKDRTFDVYARKAETFYKAGACTQACVFVQEGLHLEPNDIYLKRMRDACQCDSLGIEAVHAKE